MSWRLTGLLAALALALGCASAPTSPAAVPHAGAAEGGPVACNARVVWHPALVDDARAAVAEIVAETEAAGVALTEAQRTALHGALLKPVMWRLVRTLIVAGQNHNFGQVQLRGVTTADGRPLMVYRTGLTAAPDEPGSCVHDLVHRAGVRHVVNLYTGPIDSAALEAAERAAVEAAGGTFHTARDDHGDAVHWRDQVKDADVPADWAAAERAVARLVNEHVLRPGGARPQGHVHLHCGGGMHRTGMIFGILERCLNGADRAQVEADYKRHVAWRSDEAPGGYEASNVDFIFHFDCSLLSVH